MPTDEQWKNHSRFSIRASIWHDSRRSAERDSTIKGLLMADTTREIFAHRKHAAELSGGISSSAIYIAIERVLAARDLKGRAFDYGAGIGNLAQRLVRLNRFDAVFAADILPQPANLDGVEWVQQDLNEPLTKYTEQFDVVISSEVIEHLENPRFTVRELARLLRPGGTLIVTTPNNESWRSLVNLFFRGHYAFFGDLSYPAHITALLRKDLTRICLESNLSAPDFYYTDSGGVPAKPRILWQQVSFGLLRGLRYSDNLVAVAVKPM